jgi:uncharacterized membrane protein
MFYCVKGDIIVMDNNYQYQEQQSFQQEGYQAREYQQAFSGEYLHQPYQQQPFNQTGQISYEQQERFPSGLPHTDARFVGALCYSVGWLSGLLFALFATERRYVRYHALQSLIFFGGINLLDVGLLSYMGVLRRIMFLHPGMLILVGVLAFLLLNLIAFVGWLVAMVQAYRGKYYRLPVAGPIAARILHLDASVK